MSTYNPFDDESIFDDQVEFNVAPATAAPTQHDDEPSLSVCDSCGIVHPPDDILNDDEALASFFDSLPDDLKNTTSGLMLKAASHRRANLLTSTMSTLTAATVEDAHSHASKEVMMDVLDELTGGNIRARIKVHEMELIVYFSALALKTLHALRDVTEQYVAEAKTPMPASLQPIMPAVLIDFFEFFRESAIEEYVKAADAAAMQPDEEVLSGEKVPADFKLPFSKLDGLPI